MLKITACVMYALSSALWAFLAFHGHPLARGILSFLWLGNSVAMYFNWRGDKRRLAYLQARERYARARDARRATSEGDAITSQE